MDEARYARAVAAIDAANADDPNVIVVRGEERPKEQAHAELMVAWVERLAPGASEEQLLAARAHHLRRWALPRESYPDGRSGYLRWRAALRERHATEVAAILDRAGYDATAIDRVRLIVRKEAIKTDPAVQTHEDALCLVFLETQLHALADKLGPDKTVEVIAKTAKKMSPAGIATAASLELSGSAASLLRRALAERE